MYFIAREKTGLIKLNSRMVVSTIIIIEVNPIIIHPILNLSSSS